MSSVALNGALYPQYIFQDSAVGPKLLFRFGTFNSFLADLDRNRVYDACCSAQTAHKPVQQSRQQALISYCPNTYTVQMTNVPCQHVEPRIDLAEKIKWKSQQHYSITVRLRSVCNSANLNLMMGSMQQTRSKRRGHQGANGWANSAQISNAYFVSRYVGK